MFSNNLNNHKRAAPDFWFLRMGVFPALMLSTALSVILSIVICYAVYLLTRSDASFLRDWMPAAVVTPLIVAPIVSYMWLAVAYQLEQTRKELQRAATTDLLTGLSNRRHLLNHIATLPSRSASSSCSILLIDIDHFKTINDQYGHVNGDQALVAVAAACRSRLRNTDLLARWGGEEFIAFLNGSDARGAWSVAEDLRKTVETIRLPTETPITISIGISVHSDMRAPIDFDNLLSVADRNLYQAKRQGRNRSVLKAA